MAKTSNTAYKMPPMTSGAKFALCVVIVHVAQIVSEQLYYKHCSRGIFWSLFTRGSPMCTSLRATSDTLSIAFNKVIAGCFLIALQHPLNKLLEGSSGSPVKVDSSV